MSSTLRRCSISLPAYPRHVQESREWVLTHQAVAPDEQVLQYGGVLEKLDILKRTRDAGTYDLVRPQFEQVAVAVMNRTRRRACTAD